MSLPASLLIRSNGKPHTSIQKGCFEKVTDLTDIPFSHHHMAKRWLSKHHGPLFQTHIIWLSNENLNCSSPSPTSMIFKSSPSFHIDRNKFFATRMFICFDVRNRPGGLVKTPPIFSLFTERIDMASSSSVVSFMFYIHSRTSDSMVKASTCLLAVKPSKLQTGQSLRLPTFEEEKDRKYGLHNVRRKKLLNGGEKKFLYSNYVVNNSFIIILC